MNYNLINPDLISKNPMLKLCKQIYDLTDGMCHVGAGPYGFGTANKHKAAIGLVIDSDPDMVKDHLILPDDIGGYNIRVTCYSEAENRCLEPEEVEKLAIESPDADILKIYQTWQMLCNAQYISTSDCKEAFSALSDLQFNFPFQNDSERESQRISDLLEQLEASNLITKDHIEIDRELFIEDYHINAHIAAWFDVDNRFGTETNGTDDYLNIYANYYPETKELEVGYTLIKADGSDSDFKEVELTDSEKDAILVKMKKAGLDECVRKMNEGEDTGMEMCRT